VLLDLFSRRVMGWAVRANNDTALALAALHRAVRSRGFIPAGLLHHTDRGSPCASDDYRAALASHAMIASMSRTGAGATVPATDPDQSDGWPANLLARMRAPADVRPPDRSLADVLGHLRWRM
jgi:hypothetical protein